MDKNKKKLLKRVKLLAMDVDGTLTDGSIYMGNEGEGLKRFSAKDGLGISLLRASGMILAIITGRSSAIVVNRAKELKILEVLQDIAHKEVAIQDLAQKYQLDKEEILYIGDDLNDLPAFYAAGVKACPSDAVEEVKAECDFILTHKGGHGAIRELAQLILESKGIYQETVKGVYQIEQ